MCVSVRANGEMSGAFRMHMSTLPTFRSLIMYSCRRFFSSSPCRVAAAVLCVGLAVTTVTAQDTSKHAAVRSARPAAAAIDPKLIGVWGVDERGGYDFRTDGTLSISSPANHLPT